MSDEYSRRDTDLKLADITRLISQENDPKERERLFIILHVMNVTAAIAKAMEKVTSDLDGYERLIDQAKGGLRITKLMMGLLFACLVFVSTTSSKVIDELKNQVVSVATHQPEKPKPGDYDFDSTLAMQAAQINDLKRQLEAIRR